MKVVFKLTAAQLQAAKQIVAEIQKDSDDDYFNNNAVWCGNLLGYNGHNFSFNSDQCLELLDNGVVHYTGQRNPLVQDGGLDVLARIAGFTDKFPGYHHQFHLRAGWCEKRLAAVKKLAVVDYQTSDKRLKWYQTMDNIAGQLSSEEILLEIKKVNSKSFYPPQWLNSLLLEYKKYDVEIGSPEYRRLVAEGKEKEFSIYRLAKINLSGLW